MNYQSDNMSLRTIQIILSNSVNDISVCEDEKDPARARYLVVSIKDHRTVKKLLMLCEKDNRPMSGFVLDGFSEGGMHVMVFPYIKERPLSKFYSGEAFRLSRCEEICSSYVLSCITSTLPYALLYQVLSQGLVNLSNDGNVSFGYGIDFMKLDETKEEKDCVIFCARQIVSMLEAKAASKADSLALINKRSMSSGYRTFSELYKDLMVSTSSEKSGGILYKARALWRDYKELLFKVVLVLCFVVMGVAIVSIIMQLITGDVPWVRFFINNFEVIGTEKLRH